MMVITKSNKLFLILFTLISSLGLSASILADNASDTNKLYKWKDGSDKWNYSKSPPIQVSKEQAPENVQVAKDSKTIIFTKQTNKSEQEKQELTLEQKEKQQRITCQTLQSNMMDTTSYYRKILDKKLQERSITAEEYQKETLYNNNLEEIATDINFYDYCMADFIPKPQFKSISHCISDQTTLEERTNCLKELPQTE